MRVELTATQFVDCAGTKYGYRLKDAHGRCFNDSWPISVTSQSDLDLLRDVVNSLSELTDDEWEILNSVFENKQGIFINQNYYVWHEICHLFNNWE